MLIWCAKTSLPLSLKLIKHVLHVVYNFFFQLSDENMRSVLGDVIYFIRFPVMALQEYSTNVATRKILTSEEALQIMLYLSKTKTECEVPFLSTKRMGAFYDCIFEPANVQLESNPMANRDTYVTFRQQQVRVSAIYFINPTNLNLEEVTIGTYKTSKFSQVVDKTVGDYQLFQATFTRPVVMRPGEYEVSFSCPVEPNKSYPALDYVEKVYVDMSKPISPSYSYGHFLVGFKFKSE